MSQKILLCYFQRLLPWAFPVPLSECHWPSSDGKSTLVQGMAWCRQQAITSAKDDPDLCCRMASLSHNDLMCTYSQGTARIWDQIQFYKCQYFSKKYRIILDTYTAYLHIKHSSLHTIFPWYIPTVRDDTLLTAVFCVPGGVADCGVRATITHALTATGGAGARHSHPVGHALLVASLQEKNKQIKYFIKLIIYLPNSFQ